MVNNVNFLILVLLMLFLPFASPLKCPPGRYLHKIRHSDSDVCDECPDGTFMASSHHQQTLCRPCEKIKAPDFEILVSPCNKTHDAVIHCVDGYYRDEARNPRETGKCKKCTQCDFVGKPCSTYRNTVCCWDVNFEVVPNHHGVPMCRERPWFCRRGQYFDTSGFQCLPCPDNTFMPLDYHIQTQCWECKESKPYRPLHSVIIQPCNSTHAPVIRCEDGFFIKPNMGYRDDAIGCSPCTDCSTKTGVQYEGRKCDGMEDTVCCPKANMTVVDTPEGPVCTAPSSICDAGQCLEYNVRRRSITCASCSLTALNGDSDNSHVSVAADLGKTFDFRRGCETTVYCEEDTDFALGMTVGMVVTVVNYVVYIMFLKFKCHKWCQAACQMLFTVK